MAAERDLPIVELADQRAWHEWLAANQDSAVGVWLKFAKKGSPIATVDYGQAVEEALCFGWIDGQVRRFDEISTCSASPHAAREASGQRSTGRRRRV